MKPEQMVPDLPTCRRLLEAGFTQDTCFFWRDGDHFSPYLIFQPGQKAFKHWSLYAAPTLEEVLRELPPTQPATDALGNVGEVEWQLRRLGSMWQVRYPFGATSRPCESPVQAAALLWLETREAAE